MTLPDLLQDLERRAREAEAIGASAPLAVVYRQVAGELRQLNGGGEVPLYVDTHQAADMLGVKSKTVANWCTAGRFPGARRTGGRGGKWVIPVREIQAYLRGETHLEAVS